MAMPAPELDALPDNYRLIWVDARARHDALEAIVSEWERGSPELGPLVARVDDAVAAALGALGLSRGPVVDVQILTAHLLWAGRKHPDCRLLFDGPTMGHIVRVEGNDADLLRTWTHESLHARLPYDTNAAEEAVRYRGFEVGAVRQRPDGLPNGAGCYAGVVEDGDRMASRNPR